MAEFRQALPVGYTLAGDYKVTGVLGQGGFGITYKADDLRLGAPVAIKEYFPSELALRERGSTVVARSARDEDVLGWGRRKFLDEARTLARFRHPSIVRVSRLFEDNNTAYMVLDFEMGPSLSQWRAGLGRDPTQAEADWIAKRLLEAVGAVHELGILHRDIKPANVIMRDGAEPVLIDFGAARQALSAQSRTVHAIVTPGYSPKEQYAVDLDRQGAWSDIYALGATFYFLVTGKVPPDALSRDLGEDMHTASAAAGEWRPEFLAAIDRAMSVDARDRPQSVAEWQAELLEGAEAPASFEARPASAGPAQASARSQTRNAGQSSARPVSRTAAARSQRSAATPRRVSFDDIAPPAPPPATSTSRGGGLVIGAVLVAALALGGLGYWVGIAAPARDMAAWDRAVAANTQAAYEAYVVDQPSGRHVAEARQRQNALAASAAQASKGGGVVLSAGRSAEEGEAAPIAPVAPQPPPPTKQASASPVPSAPSPRAPTPPAPAPAANVPTVPVPVVPPPAPPVSPPIEARAALPGPLPATELTRLAQIAATAKWRLAVSIFAGDPIVGFTTQQTDFVAELAQLSGSKIELTALTGDAVVPRNELLQRMRSDRDLFTWTAPLIDSSQHPEMALFAGGIPFGLEPADHVRWLRADGARLLEQSYIDINVPLRVIPCGIAGGVGAWFRREIRSPADFKGLKVRGPVLAMRVLKRLEAEIVSVGLNRDLPKAFADNRLDANFGVTHLSGLFLNQQPRIVTTYHYPSVHGPSYLLVLMVGPETWAALPDAHRRIVDEACRRNLDRWVQNFPGSQTDIVNRIRTQRIIVRPFTGPVREALKKATDETLADEAAKSPRFKEVLDSYNRFRR